MTIVVLLGLLACGGAQALETKAKQAIMVDPSTSTVLFEKNADEKMHPSSMSKLMTLYMVFKQLKEGGLKLSDTFTVSENAWRKQGSKSFMELGNQVAVEDVIRGIIIQSGNDACIVIAEGLAGSEEAFATRLNALAREIGLKDSHFVNATGWPDDGHLMTARDLYTLSRRIVEDFPEYYHYFAEKEYTYHGIVQHNRNLLLTRGIGVDGLKTGHTEIAGYGITISAEQEGRRVYLVVNGLTSETERAQEAEMLVRAAFRDYESKRLLTKGKPVAELEVWFGEKEKVGLAAMEDVRITVPKMDQKKIRYVLRATSPIAAPVKAGQEVAELDIHLPGAPVRTVKLAAAADVDKLSPLARIFPAVKYYLTGRP